MLKDDSLVSVVIPCYNLGVYLEEALDSVKAQTYSSTEIIIVDDGSTDEHTVNLLKKIEKDSPDVKVIFQKNTGPSGARNTGIKEARGDYILCLDSDDVLLPDYIEKVMPIFFQEDLKKIGFVTTWVQEFGKRKNIWETEKYNPGRLLVENIINTASIFRKEAWEKVGGYKTEMKGGYEDWEFWISVVESGYEWKVLPEIQFMYRIRDNSVSATASTKHLELYSKIISFHPEMFKKYSSELAYESSNIINIFRLQLSENGKSIKQLNENIDKLLKEKNQLIDELMNTKITLENLSKTTIVRVSRRINKYLKRIKRIF